MISSNNLFPSDSTPNEKLFYEQFELFAGDEKHSQKEAIFYEDDRGSYISVTYGELNKEINRLANYLVKNIKLDPTSKIPIGLFFYNSKDYIVSMLAVMKIGHHFMALSADKEETSDARLEAYLKNFPMEYFITNTNTIKGRTFLNDKSINLILYDKIKANLAQCSDNNLNRRIPPNKLAYIHNTSGSTGEPKKVLIAHRGLYPCMKDSVDKMSINKKEEQDRVAGYCGISFDAHIFDIMMALGSGARLYIVPTKTRRDAILLKSFFNNNKITVTVLTPSILESFNPKEFDS